MAANVHYLHGPPTAISQLIRVGYNGYRQLETLYNIGRFTAERVVIDAAQFDVQQDLINTLWEAGTEILLDSNVAELSSIGRYAGAGQILDWANTSRPLDYADFQGGKKRDIVKKIAREELLRASRK